MLARIASCRPIAHSKCQCVSKQAGQCRSTHSARGGERNCRFATVSWPCHVGSIRPMRCSSSSDLIPRNGGSSPGCPERKSIPSDPTRRDPTTALSSRSRRDRRSSTIERKVLTLDEVRGARPVLDIAVDYARPAPLPARQRSHATRSSYGRRRRGTRRRRSPSFTSRYDGPHQATVSRIRSA